MQLKMPTTICATESTAAAPARQLDRRRRRLVLNGFFSLAGQGIPLCLAFAATPYITRKLGAEQYGILTLLMIYAFTFSLLNLGINASLVKYLAALWAKREYSEMTKYLSTSLLLLIGLGAVVVVCAFVFAPFIVHTAFTEHQDLVHSTVACFRIASLALVLQFMCQITSAIPAAVERFDILNGVRVISELVRVCGVVALLYLGFQLTAVVCMILVASAVACLGYFIASKRLAPEVSLSAGFSATHARSLFGHSKYILAGSVANHVSSTADSMLIGCLFPVSDVAYYTIAYSLTHRMWALVGNVASAIFPAVSSLSKEDGDIAMVRELYLRGTKLAALVACFPAAVLCVLSYQCLLFWLGPLYAVHGATVLRILTVAFFLYSFTHIPRLVLQGTEYANVAARASGMYMFLNLCLFGISIPLFGIIGAAVALLITQSIFVPWFVWLSSRVFNVSLRELFLHCYVPVVLIGGIVASVVSLFVPYVDSLLTLVLAVCAGFVAYVGMSCLIAPAVRERARHLVTVVTRARKVA
ncbi:MAG: flippase [Candidatus Micrarchaeaceae archaeon]